MATIEQKKKKELEGECWRRSRERKEPGTMPTTREKATESPWFLVKGENLLVREVSFRLLLLALLKGPRTDQQIAQKFWLNHRRSSYILAKPRRCRNKKKYFRRQFLLFLQWINLTYASNNHHNHSQPWPPPVEMAP
jgi:hypothetical protein